MSLVPECSCPTRNLPQVSVITPTYNHEKFIGDCIESVIRQSYQNWEQIIIDDGSTDRTPDIIRRFMDPRIRYVRQQNLGIEALPHTYNRALSMCNGELVAILEGDDMWPTGKLSALIEAFNDEDVVLAYGAVADIASDGTCPRRLPRSVRRRMCLPPKILFNDPRGSATSYMLRADGVDLVPPSTVIIRRSILTSIGGFKYFPRLCVTDFPTFLELSLEGRFYYTPEVMGYRRRHVYSATSQNLARILTHARQYVDRLLAAGNIPLSSVERHAIERSWRQFGPRLKFADGRVRLVSGQWQEARSDFRGALDPRSPRIFVAALIGWTLSWFHCDMEALLSLAGIATVKDEGRRTDLRNRLRSNPDVAHD